MPRPAKSPELHELHNTKSHAVEVSTAFVAGRPKIPSHLCKEARTEFKRVCGILEKRNTVTEGDATLLAIYSEVYSRWVQAKREVAKQLMIEVTVTDSNGQAHKSVRLNPLLKVIDTCETRLLNLATKLGITIVDRERGKRTADPNAKPPEPTFEEQYLDRIKNQPRIVPIRPEEMKADDEENTDGEQTESATADTIES